MLRYVLFLLVGMLIACEEIPEPTPSPPRPVVPTVKACQELSKPIAPPADLNLDPFYTQYCDVQGIPIVGATEVPGAAILAAGNIVEAMLANVDAAVIAGITEVNIRVGVIGKDQVTTDMPEYRDLNEAFPDVDWNERARGLGATVARPLTSGAEENILCYANDRYHKENILVHEFAHTIHQFGLIKADSTFQSRLQQAYDAARSRGLWDNTYAASNVNEYWAEGVQSFFNANIEADPTDGIHNAIDTRQDLQGYDPELYSLIAGAFTERQWAPSCP